MPLPDTYQRATNLQPVEVERLRQTRLLVRRWRTALCVPPGWKIRVYPCTNLQGYDGAAYFIDSRRVDLCLPVKFLRSQKLFDKWVETTVVHELLHVMFHDLNDYAMAMFVENGIDTGGLERKEEELVKRLERAVARLWGLRTEGLRRRINPSRIT